MMIPPLEDDPRFAAALRHLDDEDWLEASDLFEELYFEAVRDEIPLVRVLLQISTAMHHLSRGQRNAARERFEEGLRVIPEVTNTRGVDLNELARKAREAIHRASGQPGDRATR
jgi:predicted metal-dependent hydrolase